MSEIYGSDAYAPREVALRVENVGVLKARLGLLPLAMLGVLAGGFIGLGSMFFALVKSDASLSYAAGQVLGGLVFSLGLLLVVVAGAELFTGNNLLAMAWADGKVSTAEVLRNWCVVCVANLVGAVGLALLVFLSGHTAMNGGGYRAGCAQDCVDQARLALARGVLAWCAVQCAGVFGRVDGNGRPDSG